jgi:diguanylate cyclase (GGDEF)-like protein
MAQLMELDELWPRLQREVNRLMDAGNFYVALWHRRENEVEFVYEIEGGKLIPKSRKSWANGLTAYVLTSGRPLLLKSRDQKRPGKRFKMLGKPARSWLGVPIRLKGQVLGMIAIQNYIQEGVYNTGHQELLSAIAGYAAVALENSRLHKAASQKAKEADVLYQLSKAVVTEPDLDQLLQKIPLMIREALGYLNCAILLSDQENKYLYLKAAIGYRADVIRDTRILIGRQGITGWVAAEGRTLYVPDVRKEKRYLEGEKGCRSEIALPLKSKNKIIGVLDIQSTGLDGFGKDDIRLLENFANQAAAVIQKISLEGLARQKSKELSALSGIFQEFKVNMGLDSLTGELTKKIARTLDSTKCLIALYDSKSGLLTGLPQGFSSKVMSVEQRKRFKDKTELSQSLNFSIEEGASAEVFSTSKSYLTNQVRQDTKIDQGLAENFEISKLMILPLRSRDKMLGLVFVADKKGGRDFDQNDISLGEHLSGQAALLLDNTLLYRKMDQGLKQLSTIQQLSQAVTNATDEGEVLGQSLKIISEIIPADAISLMLIDPVTGDLVIKAAQGLSPETSKQTRLRSGQGLAGWVVDNMEPVLTADLSSDPRFTALPMTEKLEASLVVPLLAKAQVLGVLNINNRFGNPLKFTTEQLQLAQIMASTIGIALERAELVFALDGRASVQKSLLETSSLLLGSLQIEDVLPKISQEIGRLIPYERMAIYKVDWKTRTLSPMLALGPYTAEIMADSSFSTDEGIVGKIAQTGRPEIIPDTSLDPRTRHIAGTDEGSEALLVTPLLVNDRSEAMLLIGRPVGRGFDFRELEIASLFANQAAVAWKNAILFGELTQNESELSEANNRLNLALKRQIEVNTELSTLQYLSSTILSSLKLEEILSVIVEGIRTSLSFERVLISTTEPDGLNLIHQAASGIHPEEFQKMQQKKMPLFEISHLMSSEFRVSNSFLMTSPDTGQGQSQNLSGDPAGDTRQWQRGSRLITPLYSKSRRLLAVIQIENPTDGRNPDKKKVRSLEAFANTAVLAIENATLYLEAQNRITELSVLYEIGTIISSVLEKQQLLEKVVSLIKEKLHYLKVAIFEVEPITGSLFVGGQSGYEHELEQVHFTVGGNSVVGWVAEKGQSLIIPDVRQEPLYVAGDQRVLSEIAIPIRREDKTLGVLSIEDDKLDAFDQSDAQLLSTLANQVAVAMDNARLYGQAKDLYQESQRNVRDLSALHNVGTTVSSTLQLQDLLVQVCTILQDTFGYSKISILLADQLKGELELMASLGYTESVKGNGRRFKIGSEGITGMAALTGEAVIVNDVSKSPEYICIDQGTSSEMAVPLKLKGRVIGVLNVESDAINDFDRIDMNLLTTLATQISVAVENARLYQETEQLAVTDGLTGVNNHRYFQSYFERELNRAKRYKHPLSLIMLDIDHFKKFNDNYGHPVGDQVLKIVTTILKQQAREVDMVARYGGEEFMLVLPETGKKEAVMLAERIRLAIKKEPLSMLPSKAVSSITVSLGVSSYPENGSEKEELIDYVDKCLYKAKAGGRDLVKH